MTCRRPHHRPAPGRDPRTKPPSDTGGLDRPSLAWIPGSPPTTLIYDDRQNVKYTHGIDHCNYPVINSAARQPRAAAKTARDRRRRRAPCAPPSPAEPTAKQPTPTYSAHLLPASAYLGGRYLDPDKQRL